MLKRKNYLIIADPTINLLKLLNEFEYKLDASIDIILTDICSESFRNKFINCIAYLVQINYSYHNFRLFTIDKQLFNQVETNKITLGLEKNFEIYKNMELLNLNLSTRQGNLLYSNKYYMVIIVKADKIEIYTDNFPAIAIKLVK